MRASVIITAHNDGDLLWKTVRSTVETTDHLDREILVADNGSTDDCVQEARRRYSEVRVVSFARRRGCSAARDLGARKACGKVLIFIDGHCKPEPYAIHQLVRGVEDLQGEAIITPAVPALDVERWRSSEKAIGHGYSMSLATFDSKWLPLWRMRRIGEFYECPALAGCCLAVSKKLYLELRGFDRQMIECGVEDLDLGIRAWLLGHGILHNPFATIGQRLRTGFTNFTVRRESVIANQIRAARKNFAEPVWREWRRRAERRYSRRVWSSAWVLFENHRGSAEKEREYLLSRRVHSESWYARRFGLRWP